MDKASYIKELFENLKDKVEFDEDVVALFKILKTMLKIDKNIGIKNWNYIIQKYSLKKLEKDIDFAPLTNNFLIELLKYQSLEDTLKLINNQSIENKLIIERQFLNVFRKTSGIYKYFRRIITQKESSQELIDLKYVTHNYLNYDPLIFDLTIFLKNIILIHIQTKNINFEILSKIANLSITNKDKALLKTLFIDYI